VFAPVSSYGARRALLCKAAKEDLEVHQIDIKTAFLHGMLEEEVYVTQPPGFENGDTRVVCRLVKALYGLKQAPRAWHKRLSEALAKLEFSPCISDAAVFKSKKWPDCTVFVSTYVDVLLIICNDVDKVNRVKESLKAEFSVHDLGEAQEFLGCEIQRDREAKVIYMTCAKKIEKLAKEYGVDESTKSATTPMGTDFVMTKLPYSEVDGEKTGSGTELEPGHKYCEVIGSLLYLANTVRPDISHAVGALSRYREKPTTCNDLVKDVLAPMKVLV
jgi:Reverse transcriptase (RNA-dependent DNA polymerase)